MGSVDDLFANAGGIASIYQIEVLLEHIASTDPSPAAQELASKLLSAFAASD